MRKTPVFLLATATALAVSAGPTVAASPSTSTSPAAAGLAAPKSVAAKKPKAKVRIVTVTYKQSSWRHTSKVKQPRLKNGTKKVRTAVSKWAKAKTTSYIRTIKKENAVRVAEGPCVDDRRAYVNSTAKGQVVAKRWVSVAMSFTAFPGCVGTASWSQQYTATWDLRTGKRAKLKDFVRPASGFPLEVLVAYSLDYPCSLTNFDYVDRAPLGRWTVSPKGMTFWLERYEWGLEGACGAQHTFIPWTGFKLGPSGKKVAKYYRLSGGEGILAECWPTPCSYG